MRSSSTKAPRSAAPGTAGRREGAAALLVLALALCPGTPVAQEPAVQDDPQAKTSATGAPRVKVTDELPAGEIASAKATGDRPTFPVRFDDVTEEAGIRFHHERAASREKLYLETMGAGVGWIDYDQDGLLDAFFINSGATPEFQPETLPQPALYRNNGDGTFTEVTEEAGLLVGPGYFSFGVAVGDYDNDGWPDLYVSGYRRSTLYRNQGDGTFENVTARAGVEGTGDWATAAGWFDYDRDGLLDLAVANYVKYDMERNVVCGDPDYEKRAYCHPDSFPGTAPRLYRNRGDGTFEDVSKKAGVHNTDGKSLAIALADLDDDGWADIFIANDTQRNFIFFNNGDGTFEDASYFSGAGFSEDGKAEAGMSAGVADIDHDGDMDLYVSHLDHELDRLYINEGDRLFVDATVVSGLGTTNVLNSSFGARFFDADHDGHRDLVVATGHILDNIAMFHAGVTYAEIKKLYRNLGNGRFEDVSDSQPASFLEPKISRGLAVGDYDNDGFLDLLISNNGEMGQLFRNSGAEGRHWLGIQLIGTESNRDGIGARLELKAGDLVSYDQAIGGRSYCSAQDPRIVFGLGDRTKVDSLEIVWPSGTRQVLSDLEVDRYITVEEGKGVI
jgi:hypothetical protein